MLLHIYGIFGAYPHKRCSEIKAMMLACLPSVLAGEYIYSIIVAVGILWPAFPWPSNMDRRPGCVRIPWVFGTRLGLYRHPVFWTEQAIGSSASPVCRGPLLVYTLKSFKWVWKLLLETHIHSISSDSLTNLNYKIKV